jgi:hypothetical protein
MLGLCFGLNLRRPQTNFGDPPQTLVSFSTHLREEGNQPVNSVYPWATGGAHSKRVSLY